MNNLQAGTSPLTGNPLQFAHTLLGELEEGVATLNHSNQITYCNAAFEQLVHKPAQAIYGFLLTDLFPDAGLPEILPVSGYRQQLAGYPGSPLSLQVVPIPAEGAPDAGGKLVILKKTADTTGSPLSPQLSGKILSAAPALVAVYEIASGGCMYVNQTAAHTLGYQPAEWTASGPDFAVSLLHPDDAARLIAGAGSVLRGLHAGETDQTGSRPDLPEFRIRHKNGDWKWLQVASIIPERDTAGRLQQVAVVLADVTDSRSTGEKMIRNEAMLARAQAAAGFGLWEYHVADSRMEWSDEMYRIYGYQPGEVEVSLQLYARVLHPEDCARFRQEVEQIIRDHRPYTAQRRIFRPDGTMRYLVSRTDLVKDEDGTLLKVIGFTVDVTDLQHARQELNEKGHFIGRITETTPDVLYIYDLKQQRNVYANRRLPEVLGFTPEEVQQMGDRFLALFTHADDFPKVREAMEKLALASDTEVVEVEYRIMDPQGNWHWFFDRTTVFSRDPDGSVRQVLGSSQDVTDRKKGAEELRYKNRLIGLILSGFPLVLSRISKDGILLEATGPGLRNMGLSENQPAGLNLLSQYPDIAPYIREVMKGNKATFLSEMEVEGEKKYFQNYYFYDQEQDCAVGFSVDVTEQKEAEEKLAESRRFIEQITSAIPQIIYVFDLIEGRNIYLNREVYTSLGYSPEQIATMGSRVLEELQPPEEREMVQRHFERVAVMPDQVHELEYRMKDAGGNWRWFYCRDILFKSTPEGKPWQVLGSTQDITARKRSEEELRFKNKIIEGILSNLPVILCRIDEEGVIRESVGAGLRQLGRQDGGIVGENVFTNPGYAGVSAYIRRVLQGGSITFVGHPVHQGKSFYFLNYYYFDPEQRMAVGFSLDISQQKETEEKLKRSEEQLRELNTGLERRVQERTAELTASEERYRAFVQQSSEAIWRFEFDGIRELDTSLPEDEQIDLIYRHAYLAECNDTMAQMYGYDNAREITGTRFADLAPPSEPANADFLRSFIRAGYRLANAESVEVDRAGNLKYFLNNLTGITRGGNLIRAWGTQRDITDRRRAEDALRTSEERLELAVRAAGIGIFDWHIPEGTVILTGQEERIFGMAQDSFEGTLQGWMDFVLPEDYPGLWHQLQSGMDRRDPGLYAQYRISRTDGEIRWLEAVGKFIYDKSGTPMRAVGINVDITGRKLAGQALRESESRFRRLFESDMVGILFSDRTGVVTDANNAFLHLLGYTREELNAGRIRWKDITPAEYATLDEAAAQELIAKGLIAPYEKEYIRKDGSRVAVLIGATLLKEVTPGIAVGFVLDISDRKKAQERLHLSEERFRLVAEATNEGIWDWEISADKVWRNEGYYKLFGYEISEAASDFENWKMRLHPEDAERVKRGVEEALHSDRENWSDEYRIGRSDGTYAYIMDRACILRDKQGRPLRMIGSKIDLTQLKETQSALEQQAIELKQSNADLEQFAYISSHDLQEPLNTAASFAKLLRRRYENQLDDDANEFINFITDATDRMKGIIRSLLEYSRISSDGRQLTQVPVDKVLEEVQQNLKQRIAGSGAVIRIGIMPGVRANEAQMLQLFQNLIGNAVKFRSSQPPEITIQAEEQPGHWLFSVADNGIGMDMKHAGKKIFQVFQRLHARDEYEGTGIGLAISKKIVERHGGTIWADSQPGKGTVFYFTLKK